MCVDARGEASCQVVQLQDQLSNSTPANAPVGSAEDTAEPDLVFFLSFPDLSS